MYGRSWGAHGDDFKGSNLRGLGMRYAPNTWSMRLLYLVEFMGGASHYVGGYWGTVSQSVF